jgi:hypothetical protein
MPVISQEKYMLSPQMKNKIREVWLKAFEDLKRHGVPYIYTPHQLAGMYAVASICYDEGNHNPMIPDLLFDRLCKWLYRHFDECVESGADMLDRDLLHCGSGVDTTKFVKPYHEIAEVLLGHACGCIKCKSQKGDEPRGGSINIPIPTPTPEPEPTLFDNTPS